MAAHFILIDFENVQPEAIAALDQPSVKVIVFAGATQTKVPLELAAALQRMGDRAQYIRMSGNGKNALDFHIAFYIGHLAGAHPAARFHIVSRDSGFDPLVEHLKTKNIAVTRAGDVSQIPLKSVKPATDTDRIAVVLAKLRRLSSGRPRTVKTLSNAIASMFQKQLSVEEIAAIVEALKRKGNLIVKDNKVTYEMA